MLSRKYPAFFALLSIVCLGFTAPPTAAEPQSFNVNYEVTLIPSSQGALVAMSVDKGELLKHVNFDNSDARMSELKANGTLAEKKGRVYWDLPSGPAKLSYFVKITHERDPGKFDAIVNPRWAIFRGDDLVPAMHIDTGEVMGSYSRSKLTFVLPEGWGNAYTGWPRLEGTTFSIDNPERRLDRPTGWMIAGDVGTRTTTIKGTAITVAAPKGENYQRMDALTYLRFVWREIKQAFEVTPDSLLIVGAGDPMWRGGLSAANSLFLHADRPLVSENGTSALVHELTHMVTRISGVATAQGGDDWIAEGLAEYYSFELLYRARGISKARRSKIIRDLGKWGSEVEHLRVSRSSGPVTARAVVLIDQLDQEIRRRSDGAYSIDDVTRQLMVIRKVSLADMRQATEKLIGPDIAALDSPLLR